jgi:hypothetical protein
MNYLSINHLTNPGHFVGCGKGTTTFGGRPSSKGRGDRRRGRSKELKEHLYKAESGTELKSPIVKATALGTPPRASERSRPEPLVAL